MFVARYFILCSLLAILIFAGIISCNQVEDENIEETAIVLIQQDAAATDAPTDTPQPSVTPTQTAQPSPTVTETPSLTPTATPSPTPSLLNLSARESQLINIPRTDSPISNLGDPNVNDLAISPDDNYLAVASNQGLLIFDLRTLDLLVAVDEDGSTKKSVAWSPDGTQIAVGSGPRVWIWNFTTQTTDYEFSGHEVEMRHVTWAPDAPLVASVANNGSFGLWDIEIGEPLGPVSPPFGIRTTQFSPDGRWLSWNQGNGLLAIELGTINEIEFPVEHSEMITSSSWHPGGYLIVSGSNDHSLRVWDVEDRSLYAVLEEHTDAILDVAWSPDGNYIASVSADLTTLIWDFRAGEPVYRLRGHSEPIRTVAWFNDSSHLVTGSADGTIRVWEIP